jgi:hypothetical protein
MVPSKRLLACLAVAAALAPAPALATSAASGASTESGTHPAGAQAGKPSASERALLDSHELWATIDVCNPANQPDTVGIRGSMPGDGHPHDRMYMSFRLEYLSASKQWLNLAGGASSGFVAVGSGASARQGGTSFELKPVTGRPAVTLRGVVDFEWRHGKTVVVSGVQATTAGHRSLAGADPADYSAAMCAIS